MTSMTLSDAVASGRGGAGSGNLERADMSEPGMQSFVSQEWAICVFLTTGRCMGVKSRTNLSGLAAPEL